MLDLKMETIIIESGNEEISQKIKEFLSDLKVPYKTKAKITKKDTYNREFVELVLERTESAKKGNTIEVEPDNLWESLGLK